MKISLVSTLARKPMLNQTSQSMFSMSLLKFALGPDPSAVREWQWRIFPSYKTPFANACLWWVSMNIMRTKMWFLCIYIITVSIALWWYLCSWKLRDRSSATRYSMVGLSCLRWPWASSNVKRCLLNSRFDNVMGVSMLLRHCATLHHKQSCKIPLCQDHSLQDQSLIQARDWQRSQDWSTNCKLCSKLFVSFTLNVFKSQRLMLINDACKFGWVSCCIEFHVNMSDAWPKNNALGFDKFHECLGLIDGVTNAFSTYRASRLLNKNFASRSNAKVKVVQKRVHRPNLGIIVRSVCHHIISNHGWVDWRILNHWTKRIYIWCHWIWMETRSCNHLEQKSQKSKPTSWDFDSKTNWALKVGLINSENTLQSTNF